MKLIGNDKPMSSSSPESPEYVYEPQSPNDQIVACDSPVGSHAHKVSSASLNGLSPLTPSACLLDRQSPSSSSSSVSPLSYCTASPVPMPSRPVRSSSSLSQDHSQTTTDSDYSPSTSGSPDMRSHSQGILFHPTNSTRTTKLLNSSIPHCVPVVGPPIPVSPPDDLRSFILPPDIAT